MESDFEKYKERILIKTQSIQFICKECGAPIKGLDTQGISKSETGEKLRAHFENEHGKTPIV